MDLTGIRRFTVTAGDHVGDLVWWALEAARIHRTELESVWAGAGLSLALLPQHPTPEKALKVAIRDAQLGVESHLIRLGKEDDQELVFAVRHERRDGAGNVNHGQVARIRLDRDAPSRLDSDNPGHELVVAVSSAYDRLLNTHTVDDVRRALVKALDARAAVTLREHGGIYWVPAQFAETLHRLQAAVSRIGRSRLDIVPIHATPQACEALGHAAHESIEAEIASLRTEIEAFVSEPPDRPTTLLRRLSTFESLKQKTELYHSILQVQVQDLEASLDEMTATVRRLLDAQAPDVARAA